MVVDNWPNNSVDHSLLAKHGCLIWLTWKQVHEHVRRLHDHAKVSKSNVWACKDEHFHAMVRTLAWYWFMKEPHDHVIELREHANVMKHNRRIKMELHDHAEHCLGHAKLEKSTSSQRLLSKSSCMIMLKRLHKHAKLIKPGNVCSRMLHDHAKNLHVHAKLRNSSRLYEAWPQRAAWSCTMLAYSCQIDKTQQTSSSSSTVSIREHAWAQHEHAKWWKEDRSFGHMLHEHAETGMSVPYSSKLHT